MKNGSPPDEKQTSAVERALRLGLDNLAGMQTENGSWRGDYGGPQFLLPMYVILHRIAGRDIPVGRRNRMLDYLANTQNPDGSLGLHVQGDGSMFTTVLGYTASRLLGRPRQEDSMARMRGWIQANGTALGAAPWGKFCLALLNLYPWDGLNPVLPELWLTPASSPVHPSRLWCHARQVYLPMAYLYGLKASIPADDLCLELRRDLYDRPYNEIPFHRHRDTVAPTDNYKPATPLLKAANTAMLAFEKAHPRALRKKALRELLRHIDYEDKATSFANLGPVNAVLNRVCHCFREDGKEALEQGWDMLDRYLWDGHDGMKMNGYLSTELWDTVFAVQAILACDKAGLQGLGNHWDTMEKAHDFVRANQITEDLPDAEAFYRHPSRGGWPFCSLEHGWPITDCTAEGLKVSMALEKSVDNPVPKERMIDAVRLILSFQNDDGGWSSYEKRRGGLWLEQLNPSLVFGDIMVDISYPECTSACIQGLAEARMRFPDLFDDRIQTAVERGVRFLRTSQRTDGSWEGSWGVCFTYGTWFGVSGLLAGGVPSDDPAILNAVSFLLSRQKQDGGWGEHHLSCSQRRYVEHPQSQAVMTSWALMTLARADCGDTVAMDRAAKFLIEAQSADGGWPREAIAGVFNRTCLINYDNYRHYFPVWALAEWLARTGVQKRT
ncbi:MAG: terpene cyclase/mutase family protein [Deltaproteobacteria bacterium]|nr:terpene cyclase/mutase family protein [Deltaproteobacteria bacterium]